MDCAWCLDNEMVVVGHQAVRVADPAESIHGFSKRREEHAAVLVVKEGPLSRIPRLVSSTPRPQAQSATARS